MKIFTILLALQIACMAHGSERQPATGSQSIDAAAGNCLYGGAMGSETLIEVELNRFTAEDRERRRRVTFIAASVVAISAVIAGCKIFGKKQ